MTLGTIRTSEIGSESGGFETEDPLEKKLELYILSSWKGKIYQLIVKWTKVELYNSLSVTAIHVVLFGQT